MEKSTGYVCSSGFTQLRSKEGRYQGSRKGVSFKSPPGVRAPDGLLGGLGGWLRARRMRRGVVCALRGLIGT